MPNLHVIAPVALSSVRKDTNDAGVIKNPGAEPGFVSVAGQDKELGLVRQAGG